MSNDRKLDYENRKNAINKLIERAFYPKLDNYGEVPYFGLSNLGSNIYNNHNFPIIPSIILCSGLSSLWSRFSVDNRVFENPFSNTDFLLSLNKNIFSPSYRVDFAIKSFLNIFNILCKLIKTYPDYFYKDKYFLDYLVDDLPYMFPLIRVYAYKELRNSEIKNIQKHCIDKIIDFINYNASAKDDSYVYINRFMKMSFVIHNIDSQANYCYHENNIEDKEKVLNSIMQFSNDLLETIKQKFDGTLGSVIFYNMWGSIDSDNKTVNALLEDFQTMMFLLDSKYGQKISNASLTLDEIFILDSIINFLITEYDRTFLSIMKNSEINISYTKDSLNDHYKKHFLNLKKLISMRNKIITGHISKKYIKTITTDKLDDQLVFIKHDIRLEDHRNLCDRNNFRDNPELCNVIEKHCNNFINYIKITQPIYFEAF